MPLGAVRLGDGGGGTPRGGRELHLAAEKFNLLLQLGKKLQDCI